MRVHAESVKIYVGSDKPGEELVGLAARACGNVSYKTYSRFC